MNRRDFLKRLGGAAATIALSPMLDLAEVIEPLSIPGTYGDITRATFPFWRAVSNPVPLDGVWLEKIFRDCSTRND